MPENGEVTDDEERRRRLLESQVPDYRSHDHPGEGADGYSAEQEAVFRIADSASPAFLAEELNRLPAFQRRALGTFRRWVLVTTEDLEPDLLQLLEELARQHGLEGTAWRLRSPEPDAPSLEGLETDRALARLGGNRALYLKLLRQFLDLESTPIRMRERLAAGDRKEAERLAHTLNGVAASLGAETVRQTAAALEQALRAEAAPEPLLNAFETALASFCAALRKALPADSPAPDAPPASDEETAQVLAQMDALLDCFDVAAAELFEAKGALFRGLLTEAELAVLARQLEDYDFADARRTLREAAAARGIPLP